LSQIITTIAALSTIKRKLALNIPTVERLLPTFELGDFAVLYGSSAISYLTSMLCVTAQLPTPLGGLASKVVFVDGGNRFRLYQISKLAQRYSLNPTQVLKHISIARAFTAYQMTSLIRDKLAEAAQTTEAKLVVVSDIAGLFLDDDIADEEAQTIYNKTVAYLSTLAKQKQLIIVATYPQHDQTKRNAALQTSTYTNASISASIRVSKYHRYFVLEKHPCYVLGSAQFRSEYPTLPEFFGGRE
jgi:hypothetical protein